MILSNGNTIVTRNLDGWAEQKGELERALREAGEMAGSGVNIQTQLQLKDVGAKKMYRRC